jgi:hypothetical protein
MARAGRARLPNMDKVTVYAGCNSDQVRQLLLYSWG